MLEVDMSQALLTVPLYCPCILLVVGYKHPSLFQAFTVPLLCPCILHVVGYKHCSLFLYNVLATCLLLITSTAHCSSISSLHPEMLLVTSIAHCSSIISLHHACCWLQHYSLFLCLVLTSCLLLVTSTPHCSSILFLYPACCWLQAPLILPLSCSWIIHVVGYKHAHCSWTSVLSFIPHVVVYTWFCEECKAEWFTQLDHWHSVRTGENLTIIRDLYDIFLNFAQQEIMYRTIFSC